MFGTIGGVLVIIGTAVSALDSVINKKQESIHGDILKIGRINK